MLAGRFGKFGSAEHAGDFFGALLAGDEAHGGAGAIGGAFLFNQVMMIGEGRDLRQVSDAEHLIGSRQRLQLFADGLGGASSNAGIDFIKYESAMARGARATLGFLACAGFYAGFEREHYAR